MILRPRVRCEYSRLKLQNLYDLIGLRKCIWFGQMITLKYLSYTFVRLRFEWVVLGVGETYLAARASWWWLREKGESQVTSFLGSSRLRMLEMLKDLCEGGEVLGELAPLSELLAGVGLVLETSGVAEDLRASPSPPRVEAGERLPRGEGDLLAATAGLLRVMTLATS